MMFIKVSTISRVDCSGVIEVKIIVSTSSTSPYCLVSTLLSLFPLTTRITILSNFEATVQRNTEVQKPTPHRTVNENFDRKETLLSNFSITYANIRNTKSKRCPCLA